MNVNIVMHPYSLPLICPIHLGGVATSERTGWLVELTGPDGRKGWGEIAPLPGVSGEEELATLEAWDSEREEPAEATPSVRCGLDMAFFNLGDPEMLPEPLRGLAPGQHDLNLSALLIGDVDSMLKQEQVAYREGYRTMKVKVGRKDTGDEIELLHQLNRHASDETAFRLDANQSWSPDEADRYLSVLTEMDVEFVEEPFASARASLAWSEKTGVPVALDESLRQITPADLADYAGIRAVVLKPTLLGGLVRCVEYAAAARAIGAYPVISSMYESGVGVLTLARFATALCDEETAAGLDTYRWLARDVLRDRPPVRAGCLRASAMEWADYRVQLD